MLPQLEDVIPSPAWLSAWQGYELDMTLRGLSRATINTRRSAVLIMARWATLYKHEPADITRERIGQYLLRQLQGRKGGGAVTHWTDVHAFWAWYSAEYEVPSPMEGIKRPKGKNRPVPVLTPDQIAAVLAACKSPRDTAIVALMLGSGLRRAELSALDVEDVDLKTHTIAVRHGKGDKPRVAVLDDAGVQALWRYLRRTPGRTGALFLGHTGRRLTSSGINQVISRLGAAAEVPLHPHMFRHAWAHYLLAGGVAERNVMTLAGWSSPMMLARYAAAAAEQRAVEAGRTVQVSQVIRERGKRREGSRP